MNNQTVEQALFTYGNLMDLAGWMAAADPKRPIHELKEEAEVYIKEKLQPLSAPVEAGAGVLSKLLDYVKKSADYILDTDCKEDRYARQAYRDVLSHAAELITTPPTKEAEPIWYTKEEMYDWLINNNYSKEIAAELSEIWARDLQGAFKKGWEKATNDGKFLDHKDYKYLTKEAEQGLSAEEVLDKIFYKPETQDWYKPVLKAMKAYANQSQPTAEGDGWVEKVKQSFIRSCVEGYQDAKIEGKKVENFHMLVNQGQLEEWIKTIQNK
jgi:hypothetical protein